MAFPSDPTVGQTYTNDKGITYEYTEKGVWIVIATNFGAVRYTISDIEPTTPALGDQWWDTSVDILKSFATNGDQFFWTEIGGSNRNVPIVDDNNPPANPEPGLQWYYDGNLYVWLVINGVGQWVPTSNSIDVARAVPLAWYYSEEQFNFELFNNNPAYSWRSYTPVNITQVENGDDTVKVTSTNGIIADEDYVIVDANNNTLAVVSILSVLSATTFRVKTTLGFSLEESDGAKLSKTSFNVDLRGKAVVTNGDVLVSRPLSALRNRSGLAYIRRSSAGTGNFVVNYRERNTSSWLVAPFLRSEPVELEPNVRDDVFDVPKVGILEFKITYQNNDPDVSDTVTHLVLATAKQSFENQRIFRPENVSPADGAANVGATPTLQLSNYVSLYNISQGGAEFRVGTSRTMGDLVFSTSSDFLSGWINRAGETADFTSAILYDGLNGIAVGLAGKIRKTADGGKTFTDGLTGLSDDLHDVAHNGASRSFFVGASAFCRYSDNNGTTLSSITVPDGYTNTLNGVTAIDNIVVIVGNAGKILRSSNGGTILVAMTQANSYSGNFMSVDMNAAGFAVAVGANGEIQTSHNFGVDWVKRNPPGGYSGTYRRVVITESGVVIAVGANGAIHKSVDYGATWVARTPADNYTGIFYGLAISGDYVVVTGENGMVQSSSNLGDNFYTRVLSGSVTTTINAVAMNHEINAAFVIGAGGKLQTALRLEGSVSSFTVPSGDDLLQINNVYWWQGRYQDAVGLWSEWSVATAFATSSNFSFINQPVNTAPADNSDNVSTVPVLQASEFVFTGDADVHQTSRWRIFSNEALTNMVYDSGEVAASTSHTVPNGNALTSGTKYYWQVQYKGTSGRFSPWSTITSFRAVNAPNKPSIIAPTNGSTVSTSFTVQTSAYSSLSGVHVATQYQVSANNFVNIVYDSGDSANLTSRIIPSGYLKYSTAYKVRVRHKDSLGQYSPYSNPIDVTTIAVPNVNNVHRTISSTMPLSGSGSLNFGINYQEGGMTLSMRDGSNIHATRSSMRDTDHSVSSATNVAGLPIPGGLAIVPTATGFNWSGDTQVEYGITNGTIGTIVITHSMFKKAPRFFDVVSYTGNGAANRQLPHDLTIKPGLIIIKALTGSGLWLVTTSADWGKYTSLASSSLLGSWATQPNSEPTATNIIVSGAANTNGTTYVAYVFAHDPDSTSIIKTGIYSAISSTSSNITVGFKPQALLIKKITGVSGSTGFWWWIPSTVLKSSNDNSYRFNLTTLDHALGVSGANAIRIYQTSTGFNITRNFADAYDLNDLNATYFYMAIKAP